MFYGLTKTLGGGSTKSMTYLRDMVDASNQYKVSLISVLVKDHTIKSRVK